MMLTKAFPKSMLMQQTTARAASSNAYFSASRGHLPTSVVLAHDYSTLSGWQFHRSKQQYREQRRFFGVMDHAQSKKISGSKCNKQQREKKSVLKQLSQPYLEQQKMNKSSLVSSAWSNSMNSSKSTEKEGDKIPQYLVDVYNYFYIQPMSIYVLDRPSIVEGILWGNFSMLRDNALNELASNDGSSESSAIEGRTLQVACVYGDFTETLYRRCASTLDVVDVVPNQLTNLQRKLDLNKSIDQKNITLSCSNAEDLSELYDDNTFDQVVLFFLLHEMPADVRKNVLSEVFRTLKPGKKIVIVDYHKPTNLFFKGVLSMVFDTFEPFAKDLWHHEIKEYLPASADDRSINIEKETFFYNLYQKVVITKK